MSFVVEYFYGMVPSNMRNTTVVLPGLLSPTGPSLSLVVIVGVVGAVMDAV